MERDTEAVAQELRRARLRSGLTLREVGARIGLSHTTVLHHERARRPGPRPEILARHAAAVGLRARIHVYPGDDLIRDAAQLELIRRLRERIGGAGTWSFEVPIPAAHDQRAIDAVMILSDGRVGFEAWVRLVDAQAQLRAAHLKQRDASLERMVVVVKATHANRRALSAAGPAAVDAFPGTTRRLLARLSAGSLPETNGIILL